MGARLSLFSDPTSTAAKSAKHFGSASKVIFDDSTLPAATQRLVLLRTSQINGDGYGTDVWSKLAARAGETSARISLVAAWRESTVFTDAERAALELTEQGTRIADAAPSSTSQAIPMAPPTWPAMARPVRWPCRRPVTRPAASSTPRPHSRPDAPPDPARNTNGDCTAQGTVPGEAGCGQVS
jgi:AhpD family alkylhydroperoxidase